MSFRGWQIALAWPRLGIRQTLSGELGEPSQIWQTLSAETLPNLPASNKILPWQDDTWMLRLRRELSFSHLLELSRTSDPLARAFYGPEYERSDFGPLVRGKYAARIAAETNIVVLEPEGGRQGFS